METASARTALFCIGNRTGRFGEAEGASEEKFHDATVETWIELERGPSICGAGYTPNCVHAMAAISRSWNEGECDNTILPWDR